MFDIPGLKEFVRFNLNEDLGVIATTGNRREVVFELLGWLEREGRIGEYFYKLTAENEGREDVKTVSSLIRSLSATTAKTEEGTASLETPAQLAENTLEVFQCFYKELSERVACRAGTNSPYVFGDTIEDSQARFGWFQDQLDDRLGTVDVKDYNPNSWGLYQMHGNVWEWCQDRFGNKDDRVVRGGSWDNDVERLRFGQRGGTPPGDRDSDIGFCLVRGQ